MKDLTRKRFSFIIFFAPAITIFAAFIYRMISTPALHSLNEVGFEILITLGYLIAAGVMGMLIFLFGLAWMEDETAVVKNEEVYYDKPNYY